MKHMLLDSLTLLILTFSFGSPDQSLAQQSSKAIVVFSDSSTLIVTDWLFRYEFQESDHEPRGVVLIREPSIKKSRDLAIFLGEETREGLTVPKTITIPGDKLRIITFHWRDSARFEMALESATVGRCDGKVINAGKLKPVPSFLSNKKFTFREIIYFEGRATREASEGHFEKSLNFRSVNDSQEPAEAVREIRFIGCDSQR